MAFAVARMQRTHLQQPTRARSLHRRQHHLGQFDIDLAESAAVVAAFIEDSDQIDDRIGAVERAAQECLIEHIADHQLRACRRARAGVCAARQHAHAVAVCEQACDQRPTDETAAAQDGDCVVHRCVLRDVGAGAAAGAAGKSAGSGQTNGLRVSTMRPARRSVIGMALPLSRQS